MTAAFYDNLLLMGQEWLWPQFQSQKMETCQLTMTLQLYPRLLEKQGYMFSLGLRFPAIKYKVPIVLVYSVESLTLTNPWVRVIF